MSSKHNYEFFDLDESQVSGVVSVNIRRAAYDEDGVAALLPTNGIWVVTDVTYTRNHGTFGGHSLDRLMREFAANLVQLGFSAEDVLGDMVQSGEYMKDEYDNNEWPDPPNNKDNYDEEY
jgi:hypothetical protein